MSLAKAGTFVESGVCLAKYRVSNLVTQSTMSADLGNINTPLPGGSPPTAR